jgi:hypothetical protein
MLKAKRYILYMQTEENLKEDKNVKAWKLFFNNSISIMLLVVKMEMHPLQENQRKKIEPLKSVWFDNITKWCFIL